MSKVVYGLPLPALEGESREPEPTLDMLRDCNSSGDYFVKARLTVVRKATPTIAKRIAMMRSVVTADILP